MFRRHSIARLIFVITVAAPILATSLIGCFMYVRVYDILRDTMRAEMQKTLENVLEIAGDDINSLSNTYYRIISVEALSQPQAAKVYEDKSLYREALYRSLFFDEAWTRGLLSAVSLHGLEEGEAFVNVSKDPFDRQYERRVRDWVTESRDVESGALFKLKLLDERLILAVRSFYDWMEPRYIADVVFGINAGHMSERYTGMLSIDEAKVCFFDKSGLIYMHSDQARIGTVMEGLVGAAASDDSMGATMLDGKEYISMGKAFPALGLNAMIYAEEDAVYSGLNDTLLDLVVIVVLLGLVCILLGTFVGNWFRRKLLYFSEKLVSVQEGNYSVRIPESGFDEIRTLSQTYNSMAEELQRFVQERYERQMLLKEAQIKALQTQMNPHFLFNVLMTIGWKARLTGNETIYTMVNSLSELLRASLYTSNDDRIPVREELVYVDYYLLLQKERYGERINSDVAVTDERILGYALPKLLLQPLVENAVRHGLENVVTGGTVRLTGWIDGDTLYFQVADNGCGFDPSTLHLENSPPLHKRDHVSIGLSNTHRRLRLIYGPAYGLRVDSAVGRGTVVTVTMPFAGEENSDV